MLLLSPLEKGVALHLNKLKSFNIKYVLLNRSSLHVHVIGEVGGWGDKDASQKLNTCTQFTY